MTLPDKMLLDLYRWWPVARMASVTAEGQPHIVPIVFCAHAGTLYSPLDGKRKRGSPLKRLQNIAANPQVSLLLDAYEQDWSALWWVRLSTSADVFSPSPELGERIAAGLSQKYPQYRDPGLNFDRQQYIRLQPTKVSCWSQSGAVGHIEASVQQARRDV